MEIDWLAFVLRLLHILAAITAVGGSIFARFALWPAIEQLPESQRAGFHDAVRRRFARLVQLSILFLLVTGLINFVLFLREQGVGAGMARGVSHPLPDVVWD